MNICMRFDGYVAKIVDEAVRRGIARTKSEALRIGLLELDKQYRLVQGAGEQAELEADLLEIARIERDIKSGKERVRKAKKASEIFE